MGRSLAAWAISMSEGTLVRVAMTSEVRSRGEKREFASLQTEHPVRVLTGQRNHVLYGKTSNLGNPGCHQPHIGWLVALAAMRNRCEIRSIGLHEEAIGRSFP